ncbi:PhnA domain-containing protein [Flavobacteriaceae bacterium]|jgi:protein PhnA|nr:PhnA domain-containing protein [Flavobacteriaceae bacterium]|tara:strand:- start:174 stop:365 length:192 start_codon:yes stop_codon:yes gene_type:complete
MIVTDFNGVALQEGDNVKISKALKVKGAGITLKRGTVIKNIRLTNDPAEIDCKIKKNSNHFTY